MRIKAVGALGGALLVLASTGGCAADRPTTNKPVHRAAITPAAANGVAILPRVAGEMSPAAAQTLCTAGGGHALATTYASAPITATHAFGTAAKGLAQWQEHRYVGVNMPRSPWRDKPAAQAVALCVYDGRFGNLKVSVMPGSPPMTFTRILITVLPNGSAQLDTATTPAKLPIPAQR